MRAKSNLQLDSNSRSNAGVLAPELVAAKSNLNSYPNLRSNACSAKVELALELKLELELKN